MKHSRGTADVEILVTGGNGFVGHHLVAALLARGDRVRVLALPGEDTSRLEERGVAVYRGDICRPETLTAPLRGVEAVFHLAAMMDVWRPMRDYVAVNVTGTKNVCNAALAVGIRRLVHMSSSSVYGMTWNMPVDERFPLAPFDDPYPITKAEGDQLVDRMVIEQGLPATIIRPDQIFGPGDRLHFGRMADRVRAGTAIIVGRGDNALPLVYVSDIVQGLLLGLDHDDAVGEAFNITNDEPLTQQELFAAIAGEIGAKPPRVHVPYHALYAAAYAAERIGSIKRTLRPPFTRLGVAFSGTDMRFSIDKARTRLGYAPRVSLREGIRRAAAWHSGVELPATRGKDDAGAVLSPTSAR
jgi:nucleoside-diphosphate-sugar epimerase